MPPPRPAVADDAYVIETQGGVWVDATVIVPATSQSEALREATKLYPGWQFQPRWKEGGSQRLQGPPTPSGDEDSWVVNTFVKVPTAALPKVTAAAKLQAKEVKAAVELSSDEKKALRKSLTDAVRKVVASPSFLQELNEAVDFPDRFNQDAELAAVKEVIIENNGTRVVFTLGDEDWSFQIGAFSVDRI